MSSRKRAIQKNLVLDGQESNYGNLAMCKMNMVLHGIPHFTIEYGDVLSKPQHVDGGRLKTYDRVLANFPFSMDWDSKGAGNDPYNRFRFGIPPAKDKADFAFIQHMLAQLNDKGTGCNYLLPGRYCLEEERGGQGSARA